MREFSRFLRTEQWGGIALAVATIIALIWANSPWREYYIDIRELQIGLESFHLRMSFEHWVRDGLLAIFFFVVGLELKRELVSGELSTRRTAALPLVAAAGGVLLPAIIAYAFMHGTSYAQQGFAIPVATDIAFALGVYMLIGRALPSGVRTMLLGLAVVDDLLVIILIAALFSSSISITALVGTALLCAFWYLLQYLDVAYWWIYLPLGLATWFAMHESGIHATLAGVALGLLTKNPRLLRWEHFWQPISAGAIVPIFALFVAGVQISSDTARELIDSQLALGIICGLVFGKLFGILGATWIAEKIGIVQRPKGVRWVDISVIAALAGVGFTVAILVSELALDGEATDLAKTAIIAASVIAGLLAFAIAKISGRTLQS